MIGSGGFHCVPGFAQSFRAWATANEDYRIDGGDITSVLAGDPMRKHLQRIQGACAFGTVAPRMVPTDLIPAVIAVWRSTSMERTATQSQPNH